MPLFGIAFAQYSTPPNSGGATIEELLELAKQKISQAKEYEKNSWNSYNYSKCGLSLDYPASMNLTEKISRFETSPHISFKNFTEELTISCNENMEFNNTNDLENYLNNTKFNLLKSQDPIYTIVEDVNMTKWNIDGRKAGSIVYGSETDEDAIKGNELIVAFNENKLISIKFVADADKFDLPETTAIEKRMINSIKWLDSTTISKQKNINDTSDSKINKQSSSAVSSNPINFTTKWGSEGTADGQFQLPQGIAFDSSGNVYVADYLNARIQKFDSNGTFITKWGSEGTADGQFDLPSDISLDSSDNVYVADFYNNRIQKFDSNGTFITKWGSEGTADGQFKNPWGITVDSFDSILISDVDNDRIQKFDSNGTFITKWGSEGTADGQFQGLRGIAIDPSDKALYIVNVRTEIQKFDSNGTFITKWGSEGTADGQFHSIWDIDVDSSGNVYVVDWGNNRIQKFDSNGTFITKWGSEGTADGQFQGPRGIAIDPSDKVYVADESGRIQVFSLVANNSVSIGGNIK